MSTGGSLRTLLRRKGPRRACMYDTCCCAPSDLRWIAELEHSFAALVVYSLVLTSEDEIDEFFTDQMDRWPNDGQVLYHNMSVRLFFEGFVHAALEATQMCNESETYVRSATWTLPSDWRRRLAMC